jgi:hypothetical protein
MKPANETFMKSLLSLSVDEGKMRVKSRESEHREFKLAFDNKDIPRYAKTMAAFANRDGGVLVFGIKDNPRNIVGVTNTPDAVVISNFIKEYFEPEINFHIKTKKVAGKDLMFLVVPECLNKPIICRKEKIIKIAEKGTEKTVLREGAIYYRFSSSSDEIKYPELRKILDEQVQKVFHSLVDNITLIQKVGYNKVAVVDAEELSGDDKVASVYITNDTASQLNWIEEGRFVEKPEDGEKAFYVIKKVEIKHGVGVARQTDYSVSHPMTKKALMQAISVNSVSMNAVLWKCKVLNNPAHHISTPHGKSFTHKFTTNAKDIILRLFPLDVQDRKTKIKLCSDEYKKHLIAETKVPQKTAAAA